MRKALIVGLTGYQEVPLNGCVYDAVSVLSIIERNGDGSPNFDARTVLGTSSKSDLTEALEQLFQGDHDTALFYFSGHGVTTATGGYILPTDSKQTEDGISMDDILFLANQSTVREKIIILDCYYSEVYGSPPFNERGLTHVSDGLIILTATRNDQSAIDVNGHGIFTALLLDALRGGASDLRGYVTPGHIYSYIDTALGVSEQRPVFRTNVSRFNYLRRVEPPVSLSTLRKLIDYFPSPEYVYPLDLSNREIDIPERIEILKTLQQLSSVGLVVSFGEEQKFCRLTSSGYQYWKLVANGDFW